MCRHSPNQEGKNGPITVFGGQDGVRDLDEPFRICTVTCFSKATALLYAAAAVVVDVSDKPIGTICVGRDMTSSDVSIVESLEKS